MPTVTSWLQLLKAQDVDAILSLFNGLTLMCGDQTFTSVIIKLFYTNAI